MGKDVQGSLGANDEFLTAITGAIDGKKIHGTRGIETERLTPGRDPPGARLTRGFSSRRFRLLIVLRTASPDSVPYRDETASAVMTRTPRRPVSVRPESIVEIDRKGVRHGERSGQHRDPDRHPPPARFEMVDHHRRRRPWRRCRYVPSPLLFSRRPGHSFTAKTSRSPS